MRSGKFCVVGILLLVVGACAEDGPRVHGNEALGITQFQVSSNAQRLDVQGLGVDGQVVAAVHLGVKVVTDGDHDGIGRSLTVELPGEAGRTFENIGLDLIHLAPPADAKVEALLLDPYVAELLAGRGIILGPAEAIANPSEAAYHHGGSCAIGADSWTPQCMGTGFTECCMTHLNAYGYQPQSVVCGNANPKVTADRACFSPPTCTSGKAYGTTPVGCDAPAAAACPAGTTGFQAPNGRYQCQVNSNAPNQCPSKAVGPLGCATCWTANYTGGMLINYNSGNDTCTYVNTVDTADPQPLTVDVLPTNSWSGGFIGAVRITDTAFPSPITSFEIGFRLSGAASVAGEAWNGNITAANASGSLTATNPAWLPGGPIVVGQTWDVGFTGGGAFAGSTIVSVIINRTTIVPRTTWTALTNPPPGGANLDTCLLLTTGSVMCHEYNSNRWHLLTPDAFGSYKSGTWDTPAIPPMPNGNDLGADRLTSGMKAAINSAHKGSKSLNADFASKLSGTRHRSQPIEIADGGSERGCTLTTRTSAASAAPTPRCILPRPCFGMAAPSSLVASTITSRRSGRTSDSSTIRWRTRGRASSRRRSAAATWETRRAWSCRTAPTC